MTSVLRVSPAFFKQISFPLKEKNKPRRKKESKRIGRVIQSPTRRKIKISMKLWRVLALSVAACAAAAAHVPGATAEDQAAANSEYDNNGNDGLFSFITQELQRSSALVQRFFFDEPTQENAQQTAPVQIVILDDGEEDDIEGFLFPLQEEGEQAQELTRQEQQLACLTALKVFHEQDELKQERQQLSQRLRSPFKRAFQVMSLHYFDEASCDDFENSRLVDECNRVLDMEDAVRQFMTRGRTDEQVCVLVNEKDQETEPKQVGGELSCKLCKRFVQMIVQALAQEVSQVQVVREIIGDICDSMAEDSMCHTFLKQYDQIVDWLKHGTDPATVCLRIMMCEKKNQLQQLSDLTANVLVKDESEDHACSYCVHILYVVAKVNEIMPSQLNNVRTLIKWGCTISPKDCKCDLLVTNYDKIVGWVKQDKKPSVICEALNICKKKDNALAIGAPDASVEEALTALMPLMQRDMSQDDKKCFYCDYVTTLIQVALQEDPDHVGEIRMYADMICGMLGDTNQCHRYVDKLDIVIDQLKKGKHPREICAAMKYCGAKLSAIDASTQTTVTAFTFTSQGEKTCLYCDYIAIAMQIILQQDADQVNEIREYADMICGFLGPDNVCHQYVDKFDVMIDQLKQGKHPRDICVGLKYCTSKSKADAESFQKALTAFVVNNRAVDVQDDKKCFYCDYVATLVQIIMQEDPDQVNEIREYADMICGFLGPDNICHQYVDKLDIVIDQLKKGKHPREICTSLKYCDAKTKALASTAHEIEDLASFDQHLVKIVKNSMESAIDGCFVCTQLASILEVALTEDPSQIDQIRQIGDLVCGFLPSESKCRPVMDELDKVIDSLKKGEKPKAICHDMKFCKANASGLKTKEVASPVQNSGKRNNSCAYCSGVVTVLEFALNQNPGEVQEAREAAGIVCGLLPSDDKCHADLKMFDTAVSQLKTGKPPHEICQALKFCTSADEAASVKLSDLRFLDPSLSPSRCTICKQNSLLLASMVAKPASLATFTAEMNSICRLIPDSKECTLLVKHHDTIIDALKNNEDIESICTRIHECESANQVAKPVEAEKSMTMGCLLCEYTAEMASRAAKSQNELRLAKVALETMCTILPPAARCDVLSSKFDKLVALVQSGKSPSQACYSVALCDAAFVEAPKVAEAIERPDYLLPAEFAPIAMGEVMEFE